jgi:poly-beta-1,6-N-acetyl-D-glucosamine synthase
MIDCIFTLDYEVYGDGTGSLIELVHEPARRLKDLFQSYDARFVAFVEIMEFEKFEAYGADPAVDLAKKQINEFYRDGFEIGLHLHPQWSNARFDRGKWSLDLTEYNLCTLPRTRIREIVGGSLAYLRHVVGQPQFTPLSFRAGNWLFQPTETAASVLAENGIRLDSSVFKGGLQRNHRLDYRPALRNGYYWPFSRDVNVPDPTGPWIEVPVYADMVPPWKMRTAKRMAFSNRYGATSQSTSQKLTRTFDFLRFQYPLKLDFCRMTLSEMTSMVERIIQEDQKEPELYKPIVAIGHTKDLTDFSTVDAFLAFLRAKKIEVSTFETVYPKLLKSKEQADGVASSARQAELACRLGDLLPTEHAKGKVAMLKYVLITPARNEAAFIEKTIQSVVTQTIRPLKWVIVSDGSTDGTDDIVNKYAADHAWIKLVRMPERSERHFAGKVHAFNAGYASVADMDYDVIGNLDGDTSFDEDYFDFLLRKFAENPRLGVAGTPFREGSIQYDFNFTSIEHVSGACQMFRRECFEDVGGYVPIKTGGVDLVAVTTARMKGWQTRSFLEKPYFHHRKISSAKHSRLGAAYHIGLTDYTLGSDPLWQTFRCVYQMTRPPIVLGGLVCLTGYFRGLITRAERSVTPDFVRFRKAEQMRRLRQIFAKPLPWRTEKTLVGHRETRILTSGGTSERR